MQTLSAVPECAHRYVNLSGFCADRETRGFAGLRCSGRAPFNGAESPAASYQCSRPAPVAEAVRADVVAEVLAAYRTREETSAHFHARNSNAVRAAGGVVGFITRHYPRVQAAEAGLLAVLRRTLPSGAELAAVLRAYPGAPLGSRTPEQVGASWSERIRAHAND